MQAFGTIGAVETAYFRETGKQLLLSEQDLMDCGWFKNNKACFGGYQVSCRPAPSNLPFDASFCLKLCHLAPTFPLKNSCLTPPFMSGIWLFDASFYARNPVI